MWTAGGNCRQGEKDVPEECEDDIDEEVGAAAGDYEDTDGRDWMRYIISSEGRG